MEHEDDFSERAFELLEEVSCDDGDAATDAGHAMHEYVSVSACLLDKIEGLVEEPVEFVVFVVLCRQIEVIGDILTTVLH